jgi:uncharacterized Zn-finger protein
MTTFQCPKCARVFTRNSSLKTHLKNKICVRNHENDTVRNLTNEEHFDMIIDKLDHLNECIKYICIENKEIERRLTMLESKAIKFS